MFNKKETDPLEEAKRLLGEIENDLTARKLVERMGEADRLTKEIKAANERSDESIADITATVEMLLGHRVDFSKSMVVAKARARALEDEVRQMNKDIMSLLSD